MSEPLIATYSAAQVDDNPTRWELQRLAQIANHSQFTEMLQCHVEALQWSKDDRGYTLTFLMKRQDADEMQKLLPVLFARLKKGIEEEMDVTLFNVRAATPKTE